MEKINFKDLPSTETPINSNNLNLLQDNVENAINEVTETTIYSTQNETIAGTWIDGKPLYKKTFVWEKTNYTGGSVITDYIDISSLNVDTVFIDFSSSFIIDYATTDTTVVTPMSIGVVNVTYEYKTYIRENKIYVSGYNSKRIITIKYTKNN